MRISFKKEVNHKFVFYFFQTQDYINYIQSITKPAVNQASFTTKEFKTLNVPLPLFKEQTKIANFLSALDDRIALVEKQINATKRYKKGLLQQLFV